MVKRILVVDDSHILHKLYQIELEKSHFEVLHAYDGYEAINAALLQLPDLIFLDINMPKINGYQVCRILKDHAATKHIPIVLQTSQGDDTDFEDPRGSGFETGANAYLNKDAREKLIDVVSSLLAQATETPRPLQAPQPMTEMEVIASLSEMFFRQLQKDIQAKPRSS